MTGLEPPTYILKLMLLDDSESPGVGSVVWGSLEAPGGHRVWQISRISGGCFSG